MADRRSMIADWLRRELAEEQRAGFPRLKRVPDTQVIRFLDHFGSLSGLEQSQLTTVLADWSSYRLSGDSVPHSIYDQYTQNTAFPARAEGLRYTGVNLLAGLAKGAGHGGLVSWFQLRGITGLATQPPDSLLPDLADLVPVRITTLQRLVKAEFAQRFAANAYKIGDDYWGYEGAIVDVAVKVLIRYSGRMGRPQLHYGVQVQGKEWTIAAPDVCFESVLGVGFGRWDYLTRENAERSVGLLGELVEYVAALPGRLPAPAATEPGAAPDAAGM